MKRYYCTSCKNVFEIAEGEAVCPTCGAKGDKLFFGVKEPNPERVFSAIPSPLPAPAVFQHHANIRLISAESSAVCGGTEYSVLSALNPP